MNYRYVSLLAYAAVLLSISGLAYGAASADSEDSEILQKIEEVNAQYSELLEKMDAIDRRRQRLKGEHQR